MSAAGEGEARAVYRGYRPRPALIPVSNGRVDRNKPVDYLRTLVGLAPNPPVAENAETPFVGITVDGTPIPALFELADEDLDPAPLVAAAEYWLAVLDPADRARASVAVEGSEWRLWTNAFPAWEPHGILLDQLSDTQREGALRLLRRSLSAQGFSDVREAMYLNGALGTLIGQYTDSLKEWMYWLTIFGRPSATEPWGWQLAGHHVDVNCLILGRQLVLTPTFLGAEFDSDRIFSTQRQAALELHASLPAAARAKAVLYPTMDPEGLPFELSGRVDGRHLGGAGQDNRIIPYAGVCADELSAGQQELLLALSDTFTVRLPDGPARHRHQAIAGQVANTYFSWIGPAGPEDAFYFRIHSPVVLAEYDNHPGIFLDFDKPEPFHVHTVVRTPNGNDYGKDVLRAHYAAHHGAERHRRQS
jgi:Protein of unknown function (DUF3500)